MVQVHRWLSDSRLSDCFTPTVVGINTLMYSIYSVLKYIIGIHYYNRWWHEVIHSITTRSFRSWAGWARTAVRFPSGSYRVHAACRQDGKGRKEGSCHCIGLGTSGEERSSAHQCTSMHINQHTYMICAVGCCSVYYCCCIVILFFSINSGILLFEGKACWKYLQLHSRLDSFSLLIAALSSK